MENYLCTNIARGPPLSEDENVWINQATGSGKTVTEICSTISRNRTAITNYIGPQQHAGFEYQLGDHVISLLLRFGTIIVL